MFHNCVGYGKGKSILSSNQFSHYGNIFNEIPRIYGGKKNITTNDGFNFNLSLKGVLTYMYMNYTKDDDISQLNHVYFTSPL